MKKIVGLLIMGCLTLSANLPAFPEAQGGGAGAKGGRGGQVYMVENLNGQGAGSLRYGLEQLKGARTIIFRVGGYIHLDTPITIKDDGFITIAGQTASGDGITLTTVNSREPVLVLKRTHDMIIRYLRIRKGGTKATGQHGSGLVISGSASDIIIDHCSISWTGDDNLDFWGNKALKNITVQQSISAEGLNYGHPATGLIIGGSAHVDQMKDISIHHNFFANNKNRNPLLKVASGDIVNNIIYNWSWWATGISGGIEVDIVGNKYKAGPVTTRRGRGEVVFRSHNKQATKQNSTGVKGNPSIFFQGNIGLHNHNPHRDAWDLMMEHSNKLWGYPVVLGKATKAKVPRSYRRDKKRTLLYPITTHSADKLEELFFKEHGVGASSRLDNNGSWVANRDQVDKRIIEEYHQTEGKLVQTVDDVGGWSYYKNGEYRQVLEKEFIQNRDNYPLNFGKPYLDSDRDGMPDIWEEIHKLNKYDKADAKLDQNGDGYGNLEAFLNGIKP